MLYVTLRDAEGVIGELMIVNRSGAADAEFASYEVRLEQGARSRVAPRATLLGELRGFERERGAWALVHEALGELKLPGGAPLVP